MVFGSRRLALTSVLSGARRRKYIPVSAYGRRFPLHYQYILHFNPNPSLSTKTQKELNYMIINAIHTYKRTLALQLITNLLLH